VNAICFRMQLIIYLDTNISLIHTTVKRFGLTFSKKEINNIYSRDQLN